tara:strand:+ start:4277 stop:4534 length:258 start_codon:yes stop_codon:yes gene_type:complete
MLHKVYKDLGLWKSVFLTFFLVVFVALGTHSILKQRYDQLWHNAEIALISSSIIAVMVYVLPRHREWFRRRHKASKQRSEQKQKR